MVGRELPRPDATEEEVKQAIEEARGFLRRFPTLPITARFVQNAGRLGLLLGAGASVEFNMPTAAGLTDRLRNALTREKLETMHANMADPERRVPGHVLDEFREVMTRSHMNYEDWATWLGRQADRGPVDLRQAYGLLFTQLVDAATIILTEQHHISPTPLQGTIGFYRGLAHIVQACNPLWIFSLNHDLCLEMIATENDLPVESGFTEEGTFHAETRNGETLDLRYEWSHRDAYPNDGSFLEDGQTGINLLKLHGSLDTFARTDDLHYTRLLPPDSTPAGYIELARLLNEELIPAVDGQPFKFWGEVAFNIQDGDFELLRRSILAGDRETKETRARNIPPGIQERFRKEIRRLDTLLVVGYSFGDEHINDAVRGWHRSHPDRRIVVVSPNANDVDTPGCDKTRVIPVEMPATDFFDVLGANSLSPTEQFVKNIRRSPSGYDLLATFGAVPPREDLIADGDDELD